MLIILVENKKKYSLFTPIDFKQFLLELISFITKIASLQSGHIDI